MASPGRRLSCGSRAARVRRDRRARLSIGGRLRSGRRFSLPSFCSFLRSFGALRTSRASPATLRARQFVPVIWRGDHHQRFGAGVQIEIAQGGYAHARSRCSPRRFAGRSRCRARRVYDDGIASRRHRGKRDDGAPAPSRAPGAALKSWSRRHADPGGRRGHFGVALASSRSSMALLMATKLSCAGDDAAHVA